MIFNSQMTIIVMIHSNRLYLYKIYDINTSQCGPVRRINDHFRLQSYHSSDVQFVVSIKYEITIFEYRFRQGWTGNANREIGNLVQILKIKDVQYTKTRFFQMVPLGLLSYFCITNSFIPIKKMKFFLNSDFHTKLGKTRLYSYV